MLEYYVQYVNTFITFHTWNWYVCYDIVLFVLVDKYDSVIMDALFSIDDGKVTNIVKLVICPIMHGSKISKYVGRALVIFSVAGVELLGLNCLDVYRLSSDYPIMNFYRFTENEVANI